MPERDSNEPTPQSATSVRSQGRLLAIIAIILVCGALKAAQLVVLPVVLAIFLAILIQPTVAFLERRLPKAIALITALTGATALFVGLWAIVGVSLAAVAERGPTYVRRLVDLSETLLRPFERFGMPSSVAEVPIHRFAEWGLGVVGATIVPIMTVLGMGTLVAFMVVLLLLEVDSFRVKVRRGLRDEESVELFATAHVVTRSFQTYFFVKTLVSLLTGAVTAGVCWAMGIDFAIIWGILTFLLNFIPNIGSMIAVFPPSLLALIQFDGPGRALGTLAALTATQVTIGNFIDPRWLGRSLSLSPYVVFVSMLFWGWMWGVVGIFLAVPLTILMKIIFEHVDGLRPLAILMAGAERTKLAPAAPIDDEEVAAALSHSSKLPVADSSVD